MHLLRSLLLALVLFASAPAFAQAGDSEWLYRGSDIVRDPAWRFGTLPNGLRYAVRRNAIPAGQVAIRVRIDAGSLNEADNERGWAHFLEHMLFRGTESYPDRQARHVWQQLGASFGSDTNATTSATDTVYQLNLPKNDRASLDTSLRVLAEMMSRARIEAASVEAERPVVIAEKERRPELSARMFEASRGLFYSGLRIADRDTIGTTETLNAADAEGLRAFYRRWYRPERATVVMVGDADPAMMEALVRERFGGWRGEGANPPDPDYGRIAEPRAPVANVAYPGAPVTTTVMWLRPYEALPHTAERERRFLEEALAARILNRRLEAHARGEAAYLGSSVSISRARGIANATSLSVSARGTDWRKALEESFAILADAPRAPPSAEEIRRELANIRAGAAAAVQGEETVQSSDRAEQLVNAIDNRGVVATAATALANLDRNAPLMTPERIAGAMRALFEGSGPRTLLLSPEPVAAPAIAEGLAAARRAAPAARAAERQVRFEDLPIPATPGRVVSQQRIEDLNVTIVRFANGATLTFRPSAAQRGRVLVRLRFGAGQAGLAPDRPSMAWLGGLVSPSGMAGLDLDGMERLMTGRRMSLSFGVDDDAFTLSGQTSSTELPDQMRLLTAKLTHPRWDPALLARFRTAAVESFDLHFSSASSRASREMAGFMRPGDRRWQPIERAEMEAATIEQLSGFFTPALAARPVHAVIAGDTTLEAAIEAVRRTTGALPAPPEAAAASVRNVAVRPPAPSPEPRTFTHRGAPDQAYALIGWTTFGGTANTRDRRALSLAANIFRMRLFDELRETEGASYSPAATHSSSPVYPDWGVFYAAAEVRPDRAATFFRVARRIVADLAATPPAADEFERARNPVLSGIERTLANDNGWWLGVMEDFIARPAAVEDVRAYLSDYRSMTADEVRSVVARYVAEGGDWSMLVLPERPAAAAPASGR
ncbi:MAG TPA: insulinase family protein [Allosphingosinicella sp.]|jgi:zinc protease